jgi:hypothetical protein
MSDERLWVACPSYSDIASFLVLRKEILEVVASDEDLHSRAVRFVVVDDTAGNDVEMASLLPMDDVTVVTPPFNLGHQRALVYGLRMISSSVGDTDLVVTMDADGEDQPTDLPRLVAPLIASPERQNLLCIARRTKREESLKFKFLYFFFRIMFRTLTGMTVRSGNYAAYRGWLARRMLLHPSFDICYSSTLVSLDMPVVPVPCARGHRYAGQSRMNILRLFIHGIRMLVPFTDRIAVRALSLFAGMFGVGVILSLIVIVIRLATSSPIPGWAVAGLVGLLILSLVSLGNFLVLFAVFSHSQSISLAGLEEMVEPRAESSTTD